MRALVRGVPVEPGAYLEEMMAERGVVVEHTTVHRWAVKMLPILAAVMRRGKRPVGLSWRMVETYIRIGGQWKYLLLCPSKSEAI